MAVISQGTRQSLRTVSYTGPCLAYVFAPSYLHGALCMLEINKPRMIGGVQGAFRGEYVTDCDPGAGSGL